MARRYLSTLTLAAVAAMFTFLLLPPRLLSQTRAVTATLSGTVSDPSGGVLPGAKISLTSSERSITRSYITDTNGAYVISQLPPSIYSLEVTVAGFKTYKQDGIELAAGQSAEQRQKKQTTKKRFHRFLPRCRHPSSTIFCGNLCSFSATPVSPIRKLSQHQL